MKTLFAMLGVVVGCASGGSARDADSGADPASTAPTADTVRVLGAFQQSGWDESATLVADDSTAYAQAWERTHSKMSPAPVAPVVDFSLHRVAFVASGTKSSGGFVMELAGTRMAADTAVIDVVLQTPGANCGATAALTEPVIVLAIPRFPPPPRITVTERAGPSC